MACLRQGSFMISCTILEEDLCLSSVVVSCKHFLPTPEYLSLIIHCASLNVSRTLNTCLRKVFLHMKVQPWPLIERNLDFFKVTYTDTWYPYSSVFRFWDIFISTAPCCIKSIMSIEASTSQSIVYSVYSVMNNVTLAEKLRGIYKINANNQGESIY